jgi:carbon monoxide dehydrogenase subunit G
MKLETSCSVRAPIKLVWEALNNPWSIDACLPEAMLTWCDRDSFAGTWKIKLGRLPMTYRVNARYVTRDLAARKFAVEISGRDISGTGTAYAAMTVALAVDGLDRTTISIVTDLTVTGKLSTFKSGVIVEAADRAVGEVGECLTNIIAEQRVVQPRSRPIQFVPPEQRRSNGGDVPTARESQRQPLTQPSAQVSIAVDEQAQHDAATARGLASLIPTRHVAAGAGIFISYRRGDQPALAGRLYDKLSAKFGQPQVFMDVDSIDLGLDFVHVLERTLAQCKALVVVIGRDWLNAQDEDGHRRLDQPDDFVRLEIETALSRDIRVIPILVDGTRMPRAIDLPESIKALSRRNGRDIWNARFNPDCLELISTLERVLAGREAAPHTPPAQTTVGSQARQADAPSNSYKQAVLEAIERAWHNELAHGATLTTDPSLADEVGSFYADALLTVADEYDIAIAVISTGNSIRIIRQYMSLRLEQLSEITIPCLFVIGPMAPPTHVLADFEARLKTECLQSWHVLWRSPEEDDDALKWALNKVVASLQAGSS